MSSGPDAFHKSRFIMTFLTILRVTNILCSFKLVLGGKTGKEIPESSRLEFIEKFSAILLYQMQKTIPPDCIINRMKLFVMAVIYGLIDGVLGKEN